MLASSSTHGAERINLTSSTRSSRRYKILQVLYRWTTISVATESTATPQADSSKVSSRRESMAIRYLPVGRLGSFSRPCTTFLKVHHLSIPVLRELTSSRTVLRYLAREKKVLHRDINWRSVLLVRPEDAPNVKDVITLKETDEPIKHRYRFISNIYNEEKYVWYLPECDFSNGIKGHEFESHCVILSRPLTSVQAAPTTYQIP